MMRIGFLPSDFNPMILMLGEAEDDAPNAADTDTDTCEAMCLRTNRRRALPDLPPDGVLGRNIPILQQNEVVQAVSNVSDSRLNLAELNRLIETAINCYEQE